MNETRFHINLYLAIDEAVRACHAGVSCLELCLMLVALSTAIVSLPGL